MALDTVTVVNQKGEKKLLYNYLHKNGLVIFFYPSASTPMCSVEAQQFNQALSKIISYGFNVIGVSHNNQEQQARFCSNQALEYDLICDTNNFLAKHFNSCYTKTTFSKKRIVYERNTFIVDRNWNILNEMRRVKVFSHLKEVLLILKTIYDHRHDG